jgi:hypothetical protein
MVAEALGQRRRVNQPKIFVDPRLIKEVREKGRSLLIIAKLKFSCLITKNVQVEIIDEPPVDEEAIHYQLDGVDVYLRFKTVGSKFCGGERGFEEFELKVKEPERFLPKWIRINDRLEGEFGYL